MWSNSTNSQEALLSYEWLTLQRLCSRYLADSISSHDKLLCFRLALSQARYSPDSIIFFSLILSRVLGSLSLFDISMLYFSLNCSSSKVESRLLRFKIFRRRRNFFIRRSIPFLSKAQMYSSLSRPSGIGSSLINFSITRSLSAILGPYVSCFFLSPIRDLVPLCSRG